MIQYQIPTLPLIIDVETLPVLKQLNLANKQLAELKGLVQKIPNECILINTLTLQEAKDSSAVENIVTTHDDLYISDLQMTSYISSSATKEVIRYREAILFGFEAVRSERLLTNKTIKKIQETLEGNFAGFRIQQGTTLQDSNGNIVYTPPQDRDEIERLMQNLEQFTNNPSLSDLDPLIKLAIIHHQFESIHPFYDGNGRTGRIIAILLLVVNNLIDLPVLYLSRYITHNKSEYYALLQAVRDQNGSEQAWEKWILYILKGIEETARDTILLVKGIVELMALYKKILRPLFGKQYKHELLNNLFFHPYTKIEFMQSDMQLQRNAASKYLDKIVKQGLLEKVKIKQSNYYINKKLIDLFIHYPNAQSQFIAPIESIHVGIKK